MPLTLGEKLGSYDILSAIGAGGMGEVYRARDAKLGRDVAVKVLPEELTQHPDKLARFDREARLLAALNHPGIATLHGFETHDGKPFLVMELVEGKTLAERIARGSLPVKEAMALARQIAEALEAAHERGVIHRDLKPANIKVDAEGRVKLLDFGLAKALAEEMPDSDLSQSPTLSRDETHKGVILGTAAYMSPEQARGKGVDRRTDIFSFGAVLYEMLTGRKVFSGEDVEEVRANVIKGEPDWKALPADVPPSVTTLLRRCLTKDRKQRLQAIGDARLELAEPAESFNIPKRRHLSILPWILFVLASATAIWFALSEPVRSPRLARFVAGLPEGYRLYGDGPEQHVAFSPDGSRIAYTALGGERHSDRQLFVLDLSSFTPAAMPRTEGAWNPFFSPDGRWIGFFAEGKLKKVAVAGGAPIVICDANLSPGASWGQDDHIVYADRYSSGFLRVSADGGEPEPITTLKPEETGHRWPQHLPDGESLLFTVRTRKGSRIVLQFLNTGRRKTLFAESDGSTQALYLRSGHLLYDHAGSLLVTAFDLNSLEATGSAASVLPEAHTHPGAGGLSILAASDHGDIVFLPVSATRTPASLRILTGSGGWSELTDQRRAYQSMALDPEGRRIALEVTGDDRANQIWIYDLSRSSLIPLARGSRSSFEPIWTMDGRYVTFASGREGRPPNVYSAAADASGPEELLLESEEPLFPLSWSHEAGELAFAMSDEIWIRDEHGNIERFLEAPAGDARFSPDDRWVAYVSDVSGRNEVFVTTYPTPSARIPISAEGGEDPVWSGDGRHLYFRDGRGILRVAVDVDGRFHAGFPERVVDAEVVDFDLTPDEQIVAIFPEGSRGWNRLHVVLNWTEELKRLAATGN